MTIQTIHNAVASGDKVDAKPASGCTEPCRQQRAQPGGQASTQPGQAKRQGSRRVSQTPSWLSPTWSSCCAGMPTMSSLHHSPGPAPAARAQTHTHSCVDDANCESQSRCVGVPCSLPHASRWKSCAQPVMLHTTSRTCWLLVSRCSFQGHGWRACQVWLATAAAAAAACGLGGQLCLWLVQLHLLGGGALSCSSRVALLRRAGLEAHPQVLQHRVCRRLHHWRHLLRRPRGQHILLGGHLAGMAWHALPVHA